MVIATKQGHDLAYLLAFKDVTVLENFMKHVSAEIDRPDIVWEAPEDYHVTLVYVPDLELADAARLSLEVKMVEPIDVQFDGFGTFSTARGDKSNVLFMAVVPSHDLKALQSQIFDDVVANGGVVPSVFSDPEKWIPHITLAYADEPFNELDFPEVGGASIRGKRIEASVDFETMEVSVEKFNPYHDKKGKFTSAGDISGISQSSKLTIDVLPDGLDKHLRPGGRALLEGRNTVEDVTKEEFESFFKSTGASSGVDEFKVFQEFGGNSSQFAAAKTITAMSKDFTRQANEQFREALADNLPDTNAIVARTQIITSTNASSVYDLLTGNIKTEEKFNPYHVPAGRPPGGQFDRVPSDPKSLQTATPKGQAKKQATLTGQIDDFTRVYSGLYRKFFREDDEKKAAVQQAQLNAWSSIRDDLIAQRQAGKQLNVRLGIRAQLTSFVNAGELDKARNLATAVGRLGNIDLTGEKVLEAL